VVRHEYRYPGSQTGRGRPAPPFWTTSALPGQRATPHRPGPTRFYRSRPRRLGHHAGSTA
jgi:hypothetical protein